MSLARFTVNREGDAMDYGTFIRSYAERHDYARYRDPRTVRHDMPMRDLGVALLSHPDRAEFVADLDSHEVATAVARVLAADAKDTLDAMRELVAVLAAPALPWIAERVANDIELDGDRIRECDDLEVAS